LWRYYLIEKSRSAKFCLKYSLELIQYFFITGISNRHHLRHNLSDDPKCYVFGRNFKLKKTIKSS
jgi:hypothetical protein